MLKKRSKERLFGLKTLVPNSTHRKPKGLFVKFNKVGAVHKAQKFRNLYNFKVLMKKETHWRNEKMCRKSAPAQGSKTQS